MSRPPTFLLYSGRSKKPSKALENGISRHKTGDETQLVYDTDADDSSYMSDSSVEDSSKSEDAAQEDKDEASGNESDEPKLRYYLKIGIQATLAIIVAYFIYYQIISLTLKKRNQRDYGESFQFVA